MKNSPLLSWKEIAVLACAMAVIMGTYLLPWIKPEWFL